MWVVFAFGSAVFAGATAILAKVGIRNVDSSLATALRTIVVLAFAWLMVFVAGSQNTIGAISGQSLLFLVLSGLATGASWLCYFRALQVGDVNKVVAIDKSSTVITMLLAMVFLGETATPLKVVCMVLIAAGTCLMLEHRPAAPGQKKADSPRWMLYALLSAVFASLTAILGKVGIQGVESNLGTAIRTIVVLAMAWLIVLAGKKQKQIRQIDKRSWLFLCFSGLATGLSWLCYYRALQEGPASIVVPIDKLSILVTAAFAWLFFGERLSPKALLGLGCLASGTLLLLLA